MKKFKIVPVLLVLVLAVAACGNKEATTAVIDEPKQETSAEVTEIEEDISDTAEKTKKEIETAPPEEITPEPPSEPEESPNHEETVETEEKIENVIYEDNGLKVTEEGLGSDWLGTTIKFKIENNSDRNITAQVRNVSVNGYMIDPIFSVDIGAGKKAVDTMSFFDDDLEEVGIKSKNDIEEVEFSFNFFDSDSWSDDFYSDTITLYYK